MPCVKNLLENKANRGVVSIEPEATVQDAAHAMNEGRLGSLLVVDSGRVIGIITERDILRKIVAQQRDPSQSTVRETMSAPVACCHPETSLDECRAVMTERRIRHLPVIDAGAVCGIVTIGDLTAHELKEHQTTIEYLNEYLYAPPTPTGRG